MILTLVFTTFLFAQTEVYENTDGCVVTVNVREYGLQINVVKDNINEFVGFTNDYTYANFAYCSSKMTEVKSFEERYGTGVIISCSGHHNGHAYTRGKVEIALVDGEISSIELDGQVRSVFRWRQDVKLSCFNLVKQQ